MQLQDEYVLDTPAVHAFIADVRATLDAGPTVEAALEALRPRFARLLADPNWLPDSFMQGMENSGMGGGIASWLIYRDASGGLSLFSLVVPPGAATPVHDHLAWGLIGLYAGEQDERVYRRVSDGPSTDQAHGEQEQDEAHVPLELVERNHIQPGQFYTLLPPQGDIHSVATISATPSVSIHLLGNDTGCVWRHSYNPDAGTATPFRSGWSNVPCRDEA